MQEAWKFIAWLLGVTLAALIVAVLAMPQFERWRRLRWLRGRRCRYVEARSGNEACWQAWELWPTASAVCARPMLAYGWYEIEALGDITAEADTWIGWRPAG